MKRTKKRFALKSTLTSLMIFASLVSHAQEDRPVRDVRDVFRATLLSTGLSYEKAIGTHSTAYGHLYIRGAVEETPYGDNDLGFFIDPVLNLQYRYYYNGLKRRERGRRTDMNSMDYIAGTWETWFTKAPLDGGAIERDTRRPATTLGAVWGLQRNYRNRFSLDLNLGMGYRFAKTTNLLLTGQPQERSIQRFTPIVQCHIGIWLNRREPPSPGASRAK
jgi:hypothetical protein